MDVKMVEDKFKILHQELGESRSELRMLLSLLSHDLSAPFRSIIGFSSLLAEALDATPISSSTKILVDKIQEQGEFGIRLLEGVHLLSQVTASEARERVDLDSILHCVVERLDLQDVVRVQGVLPTIEGSSFCTEQIFTNLLQNSYKFQSSERPLQIVVSCIESKNYYEVQVIDNGIGVPKDNLEDIFSMFYRLSSDEIPGTGTGLGIVKRAMKIQNGDVWSSIGIPHGLRIHLRLKK